MKSGFATLRQLINTAWRLFARYGVVTASQPIQENTTQTANHMFWSNRISLNATSGFLTILVSGLMGCTSGPLAERSWKNPFERVDISYKQAYGLTPDQVGTQIRELGGKVASMSKTEQQKAAAELTKRYGTESDHLLRREIVYALGSFPDPYAIAGLRAAMSDSDRFVRAEACRAWGRRSSAEALQVLTSAIQSDDSPDVRQIAIQSLKNFQNPDAIRTLGDILHERDPALQLLAMNALKGASGKDLGNDVRKWDEYLASNYPPAASDALVSNPTSPPALGSTRVADSNEEISDSGVWR